MADRRSSSIRRGRQTLKDNRAMERIRKETGVDELNKIIEDAGKERPSEVLKSVNAFLDRKPNEEAGKKPWETEGKGIGPGGEKLTLEDLIYLKPFSLEDMNSTVAFRVSEKLMRASQRLKESSGGVYDITSDLYRDAYVIGLLVLSERHKSILGIELVISQAEKYQRLKEDAEQSVRKFKDVLRPLPMEVQKSHFADFMVAIDDRPKWIQEVFLAEIRADKMLAELLSQLEEPDDEV